MVLSRITLDLNNTLARRDLSSPYEMHATIARLCEGIPGRSLWRLDIGPHHRDANILLQTESELEPTRLQERSNTYFRSFESRSNLLLDQIQTGDRLRFRVRANATIKRAGKRHGLTREEQLLPWLERTLTQHGANQLDAQISENRRHVMRTRTHAAPITLTSVTFDGAFTIQNPHLVQAMVRGGIGHAKSLGFGLLTIAR